MIISRSYMQPTILETFYIRGNEQLMKNDVKVLFYLRGGKNLVHIHVKSMSDIVIFVPVFSSMGVGIQDLIIAQEDDIKKDMEILGLKAGAEFLWDTHTKKILNTDSFLDFIPFGDIAKSPFLVIKDGETDYRIKYLSSGDPDASIGLLSMLLIKRHMRNPSVTTSWSLAGKKLMGFLIANSFRMTSTFLTEKGPIDSFNIGVSNRPNIPYQIDIDNLNVDRLVALKDRVIKKSSPIETDEYPLTSTDGSLILYLSDLIQRGLDDVCSQYAFTKTIIIIDIMNDTIKDIVMDSIEGFYYVTLTTGSHITTRHLKEMLCTENIEIIHDDTD